MTRNRRTRALRPLLAAVGACAVLAVALALSGSSQAASEGAQLPPAELYEPAGLSPQLEGATGAQRVRLLLRAQPLVQAAAKPRIRQLIEAPDTDELKGAARTSPGALKDAEKAAALELEENFEQAVDRLEDDAAKAVTEVESLAAVITATGGKVIESEIAPAAIVARIRSGELHALAERRDVQTIVPSPRERPLLDFATPSTGAPDWWAAGFTGGEGASDTVSIDVGLQGEAPEPTHPAFTGVSLEDVGGGVSDHGTHVGGVVASQDGTYQGAAPGIDTLLGGSEPRLLGFADTVGPGTSDPAEVINHSFGSLPSDDDDDSPQDVLVALFGYGKAVGSGNDNVDGSPTVNNIGRNQLSMAYYFDDNNTTTTDDVISGNSSNGPSPGGRKKPDLIAPGSQIISPDLLGGVPNGYTSISGSSFSTPFGASAMALLAGGAIGDPKAQRAILINSARDWDGQANNITHGWTPGAQGSWQPEVGWGALDLTAALADRGNYELATVKEGSARFFSAAPALGAKTTLAWELRGTWDGYPANGVNPVIYTTSNLDLRQYDANTMTEISPPADPGHGGGPDAVDPNDTVEQLRAGSAGLDTIYKVESSSTIEGLSAEPFAIAGTEALTPLVNPEVEPFNVGTDAAAIVNCSTDVVVSAQFSNSSNDFDAEDAEATLQLPAGVDLISGDQTQEVSGGTLEKQTIVSPLTWTVRASTHGVKDLTIEGSGGTLGETFTATAPASFTADCQGPGISFSSGPSGTTTDKTPTFAFAANEPATLECSLDNAAFAPCSSPVTTGTLALGAHSFRVRGADPLANVGAVTTRNFTVANPPPADTKKPTTTIDSGPKSPGKDRTPTFTFSADEPASFECLITGTTFAPCSSPYTASRLFQGSYAFQVRAIDSAGNRAASPAARQFTIDTKIEGESVAFARKQRQPKGKLLIKFRAGAGEKVEAIGQGRVKLAGRDAKLATQRKNLKSGKRKNVKLGAKRRKDGRRVHKAIAAGKKPKAKLTVSLVDVAGNKSTQKLKVRLR